MKALILAGGLGTRLRPLTYTRPKHLLPIANLPHIEHVLGLLACHEVSDVVLLTSYLAESFDTVIRDARHRGINVEVTVEREPLGTAGAVKHAQSLVGGDRFFVFNGDVLTDCDLSAVLEFHKARAAQATIVLVPVDDPSAYGVVPTADGGRVLGFIEKPPRGQAPTNLINAGVYVLEPSVLDAIPDAQVYSAERQLFPRLAESRRLFAVEWDGYWMDIGTPEKYLQANLDALSGRFHGSGIGDREPANVLVADDAWVATDARISSSCIARDCLIESRAVVERSVLLPGVRVCEGAEVRDSVLGQGVVVGAGAKVDRDTLADGAEIEV